MQILIIPTVQQCIFIHVLHTKDASPYRGIATSTKRSRGGERKKKTGKLSAYHISVCFSPVVGQMLVCIHTAGHHIAMFQSSGQFELIAICSADGISVLVGTNVSEHWF